ncbi:MAG: NAD(P)H-binding protein [Bacteroidetes bacterium]|nr:NAD(P)H-binding protein [Bacteroidota bacterium]
MPKSILIIGASGLIGNEVLKLALENKEIGHVTILVRKSLNVNHPKLNEVISDFKNLNDLESKITGDALICCLGTTRKKTPNLEEYKAIDFGLTINIAQLGQKQNFQQVHLISAIGADSNSKIFYNKLKGETEQAIIKINFPQTIIYRPSLLIGKRNEFRLGELIAKKLAPIFDIFLFGSLKKYHSISAKTIAKAVLNRILSEGEKIQVLEFNEIIHLNRNS